ncbi:putative TBC1 domain family member 24 isoform X5 [Apostichopus japonicus]|uniref:Putative TBC1 domain family member 24 isoform X5 n=1 Tax=Stichopus japonicus TaxID=307972 RepID=A0A2G8JME6_STIJA|nr:putative TBC1 domain family member 24 isoform X5 [Apostichopus japonicus]
MSAEDVTPNGQAYSYPAWVDTAAIPPVMHPHVPTSPQSSPTKAIPTDLKKLKKSARKGKYKGTLGERDNLWYQICIRKVSAGHGIYDEVSKDVFLESNSSKDENLVFPAFVDQNYVFTYYLNSEGKQKLSQLLCVISSTRPDIIYCPLMVPVASLLLHFMDCSQAYDCLAALHTSNTYKHMEQTRSGHESFRMTFGKLVQRFSSSVHKLIVQKTNGNPQEVYDDWLFWILRDLPIHHLIRVMDCYLMEGLKIFYRVGFRVWCSTRNTEVGFQFRGLSRSVIGAYQTKVKVTADDVDGSRSSPQSLSVPIALRRSGSTIVTGKQVIFIITVQSILHNKIASNHLELAAYPFLNLSAESCVHVRGSRFLINTFSSACEYCEPTILLIKTMDDEVFGAYLSTCWGQRNDEEQKTPYFGTGESFMFSLSPEEKKYPWVGLIDNNKVSGPSDHAAHLFMRAQANLIAVGGGGGDGICLDGDLTKGRTKACITFNNPPLAKEEVFQTRVIEVLTLRF